GRAPGHVVYHALRRRALLGQGRSGRIDRTDVCDADPSLLRAAEFHGQASDVTCSVCQRTRLTMVSWVFGDELRGASNTARSPAELERMATVFAEFSVYVVEVCRACSWNHLVQSYVLGTGDVNKRRYRDKTAAE